ncbi:MAG: DUF2298 domain-containing protein, partial [Anaerolineae bacterium]|nr:DUF2298 domain-containing protein [Anaerolineae bacterium]
MIDFILWYLLIQIIGAVGFILIFNLMPALPDRGYAFSKPFGLLITSYIFWMFTSLHVLQNNPGGIFAAFLVVLILAVWLFKRGKAAVWNWIKNNKKSIIVAEILFLFAFGLWAFMRAASPDIAGTEKPMEMAFINAILNSSTFPPFDPWLSGYAISYYYFGYVMVALLTSISGVLPTVAFNLAVSLWFAMTALGAYGVLYALLYYWRKNIGDGDKESNDLAVAWGWLAPFFILIVSNFEGFFQMLHHANLFWYTHADGSPYSPFWEWLNIKELNVAPTPPYSFYAGGPGWWFWRASRVVQDFQFNDPFFKNH